MSVLSTWGGPFIGRDGKPLVLTRAPISGSRFTISTISDNRGAMTADGLANGVNGLLVG